MPKRLPIKLGKEPLFEAACELRVGGSVALNMMLPGLLFSQGNTEVAALRQLPSAMVPEQLRAMQPEFTYAPLVQMPFKGLLVQISARGLVVSSPTPYLGWAKFRPLIVELFRVLLKSNLVPTVERFSLKYSNLLKTSVLPDPLGALDWTLRVGGLELNMPTTNLRSESLAEGLVTIITLSGGVFVQIEGQAPLEGALISVDTVCEKHQQAAADFLTTMEGELDQVRRVNKAAFFECLTDDAISALEPQYE